MTEVSQGKEYIMQLENFPVGDSVTFELGGPMVENGPKFMGKWDPLHYHHHGLSTPYGGA